MMANQDRIYLYRMTHIDNLPHILQHGITHRDSDFANPDYHSIGDPSLISNRNKFELDNGKLLGTYIPFYFGRRMPMLFVIQRGFNNVKSTEPQDIIYCVTSVQKVIESQIPFVWTDGHAIDGFSQLYDEKDIERINDILDWNAIRAKYWRDENDLDKKRKMEAEFLLEGDLPLQYILGYICYNNDTKQTLINKFSIPENKIAVRPNYYFEP